MSMLRHLRHSPAALVLLLLGCAGLVYAACSIAVQAHRPSDGVLLTELAPSGVSVTVVLSSAPGDLRTGDQILDVEGFTIKELVGQALGGTSPPALNWRTGQTLTYRLLRGGQEVEVPITLSPFPAGRLPLFRFGVYTLVLLGLIVSGYVLLARPQDAAARLLFLTAVSLLFPLLLHFQSGIMFIPLLFWIENALKFLSAGLLFSSFLHLFLIFPLVKPALRGREQWLNGLHLVNPLLSALIGLVGGHTAAQRLLLARQAVSWMGQAMLIASVINIAHTYVTVRQAMVRSQIRWVAWGSAVGLLPYIMLTGLPEAITGRAFLSIEITSLFLAALPLSVAIAIARYRLFDIDTLIQRSLIYAFLTLSLSGIYLLLMAALGPVVVELTGQANNAVVVFSSTLVVSTAFWALRSRAARVIDRLFYNTRVDPRLLLSAMSERLSATVHLDEVATTLAHAIPERMGAQQGALMVLSEDQAQLELVGGDAFSLPLKTALDLWAGHEDEPVLCSMPPSWFPPAALDAAQEQGVELMLPLLAGDQMVGLWSLRPRHSGLPYTSEEVRTLGTLARQAAVSVQNARLVRRLEAHGQLLEREVQRRTHDLESERDRLNIILQNMADGLLVTDPAGRVLLTNPALEGMVRRPARALLGRALDLPALSTLVGRALEVQGTVHTVDLALDERVLKVSASALRDRSGVVAVLRDVTHEVEVDRMKTEFISTVSHELRTPLTSVLGFAKLIRRTFERSILPLLAGEKRTQRAAQRIGENLNIIVSEGERLTRLINDVLDIAKMEAGKVEWYDQPLDLPALIQRAVDGVQGLTEEKGLSMRVQTAGPLPTPVADPDRMLQVLTNLLSNSIKFTERGEVRVSVRPLVAGDEIHGWQVPRDSASGVLISVADTGVGIPAAELPRLFQRFRQVTGDTLTDKPQGTGLGLAICREIVSHYGGAIWAESTPGAGSTFYFTLPLAAVVAPDALSSRTTQSHG